MSLAYFVQAEEFLDSQGETERHLTNWTHSGVDVRNSI